MKTVCRWLAAAACVMLWNCASGNETAYTDAEPAQRDTAAFEKRVRTLAAACPRLKIETLGVVVYSGGFEAPLECLHVAPQGPVKRRVLVVGGVHGDEPAGVESALRLAGNLCGDPGRWPDTAFEIVPLLNPWGWSRDRRRNRDGRDINRDFASFDTQEARLLRDFIQLRRYDLALDLHEDPAARGFYLYQYDRADQTLSRRIIDRIARMGFEPEENVRMVILRTDHGLIDAPRWGLHYMRLTRQLSLANVLRLEHSPAVFTVETPPHLELNERCRIHLTALEMLVDAIP